jgi:hypothetical protein
MADASGDVPMTTDAYLWAIFILLWIALVLVVVTARRGPWERKLTSGVRFTKADKGTPIFGLGIPDGAYIYAIDSPTQVTLRQRRSWKWWKRSKSQAPVAQHRAPVTVLVGGEPVTIEPVPGSMTLEAIGPVFRVDMVGAPVAGVGIPMGTVIASVTSAKVAVMSQAMALGVPPDTITLEQAVELRRSLR